MNVLVWLEKQSRWSKLRALGNSGMVKSSVLMPVFGYMLLLNDKVHEYLTLKFDEMFLSYLPDTWRIWFVFYGSLFLAIGSALYAFRCPSEIKRYEAPVDLIAAEPSYHWPLGTIRTVRERTERAHASLSEWQKALTHIQTFSPNASAPHNNDSAKQDLTRNFTHFWNIRNVERYWSRTFVHLFFCVGIILLLIPSAITIAQVTWAGIQYLL